MEQGTYCRDEVAAKYNQASLRIRRLDRLLAIITSSRQVQIIAPYLTEEFVRFALNRLTVNNTPGARLDDVDVSESGKVRRLAVEDEQKGYRVKVDILHTQNEGACP